MTSVLQILLYALDIAQWVVLAHVIMSWLINFQVLNYRQPIVQQVWDVLQRITGPVYTRVRRYLPATGGIDFAPLVVLFVIFALRIIITNNLYR